MISAWWVVLSWNLMWCNVSFYSWSSLLVTFLLFVGPRAPKEVKRRVSDTDGGQLQMWFHQNARGGTQAKNENKGDVLKGEEPNVKNFQLHCGTYCSGVSANRVGSEPFLGSWV